MDSQNTNEHRDIPGGIYYYVSLTPKTYEWNNPKQVHVILWYILILRIHLPEQ